MTKTDVEKTAKTVKEEKTTNYDLIGIPVKNPPKRVCDDVNCPFHGNIRIHGRIMTVKVVDMKSRRTAKVEWEEVIHVKKYERAYRIKRKLLVHKPDCLDIKVGDTVKIGETRPISKMKNFVIFDVLNE
ncbi:MAG: 30S ribosomal protein S17 [Candidatus Woesearchaeota archaeon]